MIDTIIDVNGQERNIESIKIISHKRTNDSIAYERKNIKGELKLLGKQKITDVEEKFVETVIKGKNGNWIEWYPLEKFEKMNPMVKL